MPFRAKLRKTFSSKKSSSGSSTPSTTNNDNTTRRTDIEYYKPNEIPKSKYRGRVDPEHKERLESYSFADAFNTLRRKSSQALSGTFSPGGTKSQSRRASWMSFARPKSSMSTATSFNGTTRSGSEGGASLGGSKTKGRHSREGRRKSVVAQGVPGEETVKENEDDDTDVANAGISKAATAPDHPPDSTTMMTGNRRVDIPTLRLERTSTVGPGQQQQLLVNHDAPFSAEELEKAMTRATLNPRQDSEMPQTAEVAA